MNPKLWFLLVFVLCFFPALLLFVSAKETDTDPSKVETDWKDEKIPLKTDDDVVEREQQHQQSFFSDGYTDEEREIMKKKEQKFEFQAEVNKLMGIIINSLYSNKEIFLREVISNASDAMDKIKFLKLTDQYKGDLGELDIRIQADPESRTLTITDKGIGMTRDQLITNLGTIAKSGTKEFAEALAKGTDTKLIGQFGVGFYSTFLVSDRVTVTSKHSDEEKQYIWESTSEQSFTVTEDPKGNTLGRGTRLTLHIKEDCLEFLKDSKLKELIIKYSEFINYPIYLWASREVSEQVPVDDEEEATEDEEALNLQEDETEEDETGRKTKTVKKTVWDWELVNVNKPIWTRNPKEITDDEYKNFYRSFTKDYEDPIAWTHFTAEGDVEFKAILYIPQTPPQGLFDNNPEQKSTNGLKLYVRRVFITDDFDKFIPRYLKFLRGVVDSQELPLNVSREILQQDRTTKIIRNKLVRKAISLIQDLATDKPEKFKEFWTKYGVNIKLGVAEDKTNKTRLSKLLRFHSSKTGDLTSLDDYISRMKEGQTQIYYLAGESLANLEKSPLVEKLLKKGFEVLYMTDAIDEWTAQSIGKYDEKYSLTNVAKEGLKIDGLEEDKDKDKEKEVVKEFKPLTDYLQHKLKGKISKAVISNVLVTTPAALASGLYGFTANMERLAKAQALADKRQFEAMKSQRVLELNPKHPIITELLRRVENDEKDPNLEDLAVLLYETACLNSGFSVDDPTTFVGRVHKIIKENLNIPADAEAEVEPEPLEEENEKKTDDKNPTATDEEDFEVKDEL